MSSEYMTRQEYDQKSHGKKGRIEAEKKAGLDRRHALTVERNLHNFTQLENAGFPQAKTIEINQWVESRTIGFTAKLLGFDVHKIHGGHGEAQVITKEREKGYLIPGVPLLDKKKAGAAITTSGFIYPSAERDNERNCIVVNRFGLVPLSKQKVNKGIRLEDYKGETAVPVTAICAPESDEIFSMVTLSENISHSFSRLTKYILGREYEQFPPDMAQKVKTVRRISDSPGATEEKDYPATQTMPLPQEPATPATEILPQPITPPTAIMQPSDGLVSPVDYMGIGAK